MVGMTSQYTVPLNANQIHLLQMNRLSLLSKKSSYISISSSPSISPLIPQRPTAPLQNRVSFLSENSSRTSISSSPNTISLIQQRPTAPSEAFYIYNKYRNSENNRIESKQYHHFRDDI